MRTCLAYNHVTNQGLPILSRMESLAEELMVVIDNCSSYCSYRVLPLGPDYISIS